jgi:transcriptional antiterminator RfaH
MNWYAIYTKPRWEKKVLTLLEKNNVEAYIPTREILKQYTDRRKKVIEIVLPSYVFVKINENQKELVRYTSGVVNFVYWLGKPAVIRSSEIEALRKFLGREGELHISTIENKIGDKIELDQHPFKGKIATITKINKNTTELILDSLQIKLTITNSK